MEVRCGSCNKLFRVSDDKITGTGIKFICTRCGEYVKITREDFEHYTLSQDAASALDLFVPKPAASPTPSEMVAAASAAAPQVTFHDTALPQEPASLFAETDSAAGMGDSFARQQTEPESSSDAQAVTNSELPSEHAFLAESEHEAAPAYDFLTDTPTVTAQDPMLAPAHEFMAEAQAAAASSEPAVASELFEELRQEESTPEPAIAPKEDIIIAAMEKAERNLEPGGEKKVSTPPLTEADVEQIPARRPAAARPVAPAASRPSSPAEQAPLMKERVLHETAREEYEAAEPSSAHTRTGHNRMYAVLSFVVLLLGGLGVYLYQYMMPHKESAPSAAMVSIAGMQIANPAGTIDANGDLLITGVVENSTDQERTAWYVVADVFNAQGVVLDKIRMLNGKQLFTKREYDILAARGENIQDLKAKVRQQQGSAIPAKGSTPFTMRYIQPPSTVASFTAVLTSFDPERLYKEVSEENK